MLMDIADAIITKPGAALQPPNPLELQDWSHHSAGPSKIPEFFEKYKIFGERMMSRRHTVLVMESGAGIGKEVLHTVLKSDPLSPIAA